MSNLLEENAVSDRKQPLPSVDLNGNKLSQQAIELLTTVADCDKVSKAQLSEVYAPIFKDAKNYPLAPAAKMMLDEFQIVDANKDGGVDGKEIFQYVAKNAERLSHAPRVKSEDEPWYISSYEDAKTMVSIAGNIVNSFTSALSPYSSFSSSVSALPSVGAVGGFGEFGGFLPLDRPHLDALRGADIAYRMLTKEPKDGHK